MASDFLKKNFASLRSKFKGSMTDEEKEKFKKFNKKNDEFFKKYKDTIKGTISDEELELLKSVLPK
ncbi:hypothetical protein [uncultured Mediterranean phage uvMED]|nr:hypothetical protein [uncultured Mediterranean phage uvMED]|tara:strand:+ start:270 stop:467 length:198 start_codon:yes stop_codon:yes gene_type:complete